jgi:predicted porin
MKSHKLALSALTVSLAAASSQAMAQSSVTLYGVVDAGVSYSNNVDGGSQVYARSGSMSGGRWGLKGTEDLGGGMKAIFRLENGFNIYSGALGQGSREFGRSAYVGLQTAQFGTLTLGRQYDPIADLEGAFDGDGVFGSIFVTSGDVDNSDASLRFNNAIKYTSPVYAGLQFEGMYALGGVAGDVSAGNAISGAVLYSMSGLNLAGGYLYTKNNNTTANTAGFVADNQVTKGYTLQNGSFQTIHAAGAYTFNKFTVGARYSNSQYKTYVTTAVVTGTEKFNVGSGYVAYQFTPSLKAAVNYSYTKSSGVTSATYNQISAGVDYFLSKTTDVYALAGYTKASGSNVNATGTAIVSATASVGDFSDTSSNNKQVMAVVGIRHKF